MSWEPRENLIWIYVPEEIFLSAPLRKSKIINLPYKAALMKMYSKEGAVMMDAQSLRREGDNLIMKGKIMEAMSMSIYLKPEDIWEARKLLSWSIIWYLPVIIIKGWWRSMMKKRT
ncbi:conserved hypothetical protein [uncultured Desulfobacterium sp.]|uniref:Uncharacterized protein n=1 Tax=uncultured Desulfobacterium sp. TaxID=201089 RepID=A0A445MW49_9BACT|nr:conserved hypothetical protein [uncultured Desulfobacterium sp.]